MVSFDGRTHEFGGVARVEITKSDRSINLIRTSNYDHWGKLSSKLL
jgi:NAD kinase